MFCPKCATPNPDGRKFLWLFQVLKPQSVASGVNWIN